MRESLGDASSLSERVRTIRLELFGAYGGPMLASLLRIPQRRLARMEAGGPIPAQLILRFIEVTGASPRWLMTGQGDPFGLPPADGPRGGNPDRRAPG